jgi:hypothetical protein
MSGIREAQLPRSSVSQPAGLIPTHRASKGGGLTALEALEALTKAAMAEVCMGMCRG